MDTKLQQELDKLNKYLDIEILKELDKQIKEIHNYGTEIHYSEVEGYTFNINGRTFELAEYDVEEEPNKGDKYSYGIAIFRVVEQEPPCNDYRCYDNFVKFCYSYTGSYYSEWYYNTEYVGFVNKKVVTRTIKENIYEYIDLPEV
jgi:hypothetical protein